MNGFNSTGSRCEYFRRGTSPLYGGLYVGERAVHGCVGEDRCWYWQTDQDSEIAGRNCRAVIVLSEAGGNGRGVADFDSGWAGSVG
jgi:hypothetical protein